MKGASVRPGAASDAEAIAGFQCAMARETEEKGLDPEVVLRAVRRALDDPGRGEYLVAERDGEVVGSLMLTREWSDWRDGWWLWIQSVYVVPAARRTGVYRTLYEAALERGRVLEDVLGVRLYVEAENDPARSTYESLGMVATSYRIYECSLEGRSGAAGRPPTP